MWRELFSNPFPQNDYLLVVEDKTYAVPDNVRYEFRGPNPGKESLLWGRRSQKGANDVLAHSFVLSAASLDCLRGALQAGKCPEGLVK
jgi:hypothetical protein